MKLACFATLLALGCGRVAFEPVDDAGSVIDTGDEPPADAALSSIRQTTYIKASNTRPGALFGIGLALSADGSTLAVGSPFESSNAQGINGNESDTTAPDAGAVYVYVRAGNSWVQQAYVKGLDTITNDNFGTSVALSSDGSILAVGAFFDDNEEGSVYMFTRSGTTWAQVDHLKASNPDPGDRFGDRVALSGDGSLLAVTAYREASAATGIDGNQADNSAPFAGAAYTFLRSGATWTQQSYIKASNTEGSDLFGYSIAVSDDGMLMAIGAEDESGGVPGTNGDQADNSQSRSGAAYMYERSGATWVQTTYVKSSNPCANCFFGVNLALSPDGSTLAVGAYGENNQAGAAYVFTRSGGAWSQQARIVGSNTETGDLFGAGVALSADGSTMVLGAIFEASAAPGINASQSDNSLDDAGAAYLYIRSGTTWTQTAYIKASTPGIDDELGLRAALSSDGGTLALSAYQEASIATGINGNETLDTATQAGAVYIFQ